MRIHFRHILMAFGLAAVLASCVDPEAPSASVTPRTASMDCNGGVSVFALTCNTTWTATSDLEGVTINPSSGEGNASITVTVPPSTYPDTKSIRIAVKAANDQTTSTYTARHTITLAPMPYISLSANEGYVSPDGGGLRVSLTSNQSWTVEAEPYIQDMSIMPPIGTWNSEIAIALPANTTGAARSTKITFTTQSQPEAKAEFLLKQNAQ